MQLGLNMFLLAFSNKKWAESTAEPNVIKKKKSIQMISYHIKFQI